MESLFIQKNSKITYKSNLKNVPLWLVLNDMNFKYHVY